MSGQETRTVENQVVDRFIDEVCTNLQLFS